MLGMPRVKFTMEFEGRPLVFDTYLVPLAAEL